MLDRLATFVEPILLTGDISMNNRPTLITTSCVLKNVSRLPLTTSADRWTSLRCVWICYQRRLTSSMWVCHDHHMLRWTKPLAQPSPVYSSMTSPSWSRLDKDSFYVALRLTQLSRPESWSTLDVDELAWLYDNEITRIIDGMIPKRTVRFMRRHHRGSATSPHSSNAFTG